MEFKGTNNYMSQGQDVGVLTTKGVNQGGLVSGVIPEDSILTSGNVQEIYDKCSLKDDEVINGNVLVGFVIAEGIQQIGLFNSDRLLQFEEQITSMIDEISDFDEGEYFFDFCFTKDGRKWTEQIGDADMLVQLGLAIGVLDYSIPRDFGDEVEGNPLFNRVKDKNKKDAR